MSLEKMSVKDTTQKITVTSTSAKSTNAFGDDSTHVRVIADIDVHIVFGSDPTATTSKMYLPADTVEYFKVPDGGSTKIAVIRGGSTDGNCWVTEYGL